MKSTFSLVKIIKLHFSYREPPITRRPHLQNNPLKFFFYHVKQVGSEEFPRYVLVKEISIIMAKGGARLKKLCGLNLPVIN